ncbi:MAG: cob(I)yrinic acid a,c-diamide adenosyltransferase [Patescibacteria group bacterium]|nr:cob(I)yrinic acid a,c-diamide adenosyltransferase [Patescibacteria group bacterium]
MPKKLCQQLHQKFWCGGQADNLILIYTGNGKGKTSASLGLALRAMRDGMKVIIIQFIKSESGSGEVGLKKILPKLEVRCFGRGLTNRNQKLEIRNQEKQIIVTGLEFAEQKIKSGKYQVVILDEIFVAYGLGLIKLSDIIKLIKQARLARDKMFLVLTGRGCPKELYRLTDLVTEMKEIKHPYKKGIQAIKGIDY